MDIYELRERLRKIKPDAELSKTDTALVLIDVQRLAGPEYLEDVCQHRLGLTKEEYGPALEEYTARFEKSLQNISRVLNACREAELPVIHVKIEELLDSCRDASLQHKTSKLFVKPGTFYGEFYPEVQPQKNEIVLTKVCSGAVTGTRIDYILRNMGIRNVILIGYYTDECITTTARDLADTGYVVTVVTDATGALTQRQHEFELDHLVNVYTRGDTTDGIIKRIQAL